MARTTAGAVRGILQRDYDTARSPDLQQYIDAATVIVSRVKTCAIAKGKTLTVAELELVERWLAAYFYTRSDPIYQTKSTEGASAGFVADPVDPERYRAGALAIDYSGCLAAILKRKTATGFCAGKAPSEQTDYVDRS